MKKNYGFTLIELIVVVALMSVLGVIFNDILVQTLRGENKVRAINHVKQNGQNIMERLTNEIRQARKVVCTGKYGVGSEPEGNTIVVFNEGYYKRYRMVSGDGTSTNGSILSDTFTEDDITDLAMRSPSNMCIALDLFFTKTVKITDTDPVNGVSINADGINPIFKQDSRPGYKDIITIRFLADAPVSAGSSYENIVKMGGILFTTSVQVRGMQ